jgi:nucleotide-binding universal stress UspA family protein
VITNILIPTDFSPNSWLATQMAVDIAVQGKSNLLMLHIYPIVSRFSLDKNEVALPVKLDEIKTRLNEISKDISSNSDVKIESKVLPGNIESTLLQFILDNQFDLVVLGINSHGANNELGSHSTSLIEKCGIPVLIVPNKKVKNGSTH